MRPLCPYALALALVIGATACTSDNPAFDPLWRVRDFGATSDLIARVDTVGPVSDGGSSEAGAPDSAPSDRPVGIDVLLVVDNSGGMERAQARLIADIGALLTALDAMPGGANYRIGVTTSDIGVGPFANQGCTAVGTGGKLVYSAGCPKIQGDARFVEKIGARANVAGDIERAVACAIESAGTSGCGFEQPLEAMRKSVAGAAGFLRADAALAVVVLSNEDDCSATSNDLFNPGASALGPYTSYRCFRWGIVCDSKLPPLAATILQSCVPGNMALHPTKARYVDFLRKVKRKPAWVVTSVIGGPVTAKIEVERAFGNVRLKPVCRSNGTDGYAGIRLQQFAHGFGASGGYDSVCSSSYRNALTFVTSRLRPLFN